MVLINYDQQLSSYELDVKKEDGSVSLSEIEKSESKDILLKDLNVKFLYLYVVLIVMVI